MWMEEKSFTLVFSPTPWFCWEQEKEINSPDYALTRKIIVLSYLKDGVFIFWGDTIAWEVTGLEAKGT